MLPNEASRPIDAIPRGFTMLTLYFSPGACSLASHIAIEETGAPYEAKLTALAKGEQRTPEYLAINPRARVPALKTEDGVITENVAIVTYLAKRFPEKTLLPRDLPAEVRCISTMAWLSNTIHPGFTRACSARSVSPRIRHP